jgi:hypothetical protein
MEHPVPNFDAWKREGFDRDPLDRKQSGVQYHKIMRPLGDEKYVMIDLGFARREEAEAMLERLNVMWGNVKERFGWTESPRARIVEVVEEKEY